MTRNNDVYKEDREKLNSILLTSSDTRDISDEILKLVPELNICRWCEQNNPSHEYEVYGHILKTVNLIEKSLLLRVSALLHDIGKPYKKYTENGVDRFTGHWSVSVILADLILRRLGYDGKFISDVFTLVEYHDYLVPPTREGVISLRNLVGVDLLPNLLRLKKADLSAHKQEYFNEKLGTLNKIIEIYNNEFAPDAYSSVSLLTYDNL